MSNLTRFECLTSPEKSVLLNSIVANDASGLDGTLKLKALFLEATILETRQSLSKICDILANPVF